MGVERKLPLISIVDELRSCAIILLASSQSDIPNLFARFVNITSARPAFPSASQIPFARSVIIAFPSVQVPDYKSGCPAFTSPVQILSPSRRLKFVACSSKSDGVYQPWHLSPNTHCNGGLKNAVDSAKDRLSWRLWVSTLGSNTYSFGSGMRIIIDKRMREMCGNAPVWIPDGKLESCYDEYCHQRFYGLVSTMRSQTHQRPSISMTMHRSSSIGPSISISHTSLSKITTKATSLVHVVWAQI
ncbi:hypothetical protein EDD17DRAFT_867399 [Pisolithus thermaeus]|nr:hypothetical protein EDD17DRAFT_867399 [Pisolithus thermaeus]